MRLCVNHKIHTTYCGLCLHDLRGFTTRNPITNRAIEIRSFGTGTATLWTFKGKPAFRIRLSPDQFMPPSVKVVIVNWDGKRFLSECLDGLRGQLLNFQ